MSGYYTNDPATGEITCVADKSVGMTGASHDTAGTAGYVPAPQAGDDEKFLRGDGTWVELHGGGGVDIGDVSGEMATTFGTSAFLTWSDPNDIILEGVKLAQWAGTLVVRKAGSAPETKTDGTSIVNNTTRNAYSSTPFEDTGLTYGVTYYYRFFPYTKDKRYTDGSSVQITPARQEIYTTPSISETLTYDGTAQTVTITNFDSSKMTKSGDTQTNAGTYTAVVTPKEGYCWSNGSYAPLELSWTIEKDTVDIPSTATSFTYDGTEHSAITEEYDPDLITVTGNTEETDVGSYSFTMALADPDNYDWEDGTTAAKTVSWRILAEALTVPTVTGSFTYDGTEKTPTIGTYDNTKITIVSGDSGTNAGTYNVVFRIIDPSNYVWTDGTTADKEGPWTIAKAQLTAPTVSSSLYYTGTSQNATVSSYDSTLIEVTGTSGTNAGTYTATKHLLDSSNYEWSDGTVADKTENWSIGKAVVNPPTVSSTLVYNGQSQTASVSTYDSNIITVTGITGTNAGSYTATLSLNDDDNYEWNDHTTADKTASWSIAKASGSATVSSNSVSVDATTTTATVTVSNATGTVSVESSDSSVATASVSGNTITITGLANGSATITVKVAASLDGNYTANNSATSIAVTASFTPTLEQSTWDEIAEIGAAGTGANYWSIGDTKTITLNGTVGTLALNNQDVKVFIIEFNYRGDNGIYFQGFKSTDATPVDIALCDANYGTNKSDGTKTFNMNHWGGSSTPYNTNYGGWKGCDLRYDILGSTKQVPSGYGSTPTTSRAGYDATSGAKTSPVSNTLMAALPSALRNVLAAWTVYTDNKGNSSNAEANVTTSVDYLPLLAEYEIHGARSYANQYENTSNKQKQMTYYANGNSKIKYKHSDKSTAVVWWCRSASYTSAGATNFCSVSSSGNANTNASRFSYGLAPAFRVKATTPIYGAEWAGTSSSAWTRTDDAASFSAPSPALNNGNGSSPFDNIMPWAGMKRVEDSAAGTLVEIPKYYYKWTRNGVKMKLQISMKQEPGFLCSPAHADRGDGKGERDVVYVGAYHCASTYKSTTGVAPLGSVTRANFRTNIHNLGSNIWQYDYAMYWTIMMLYLVEFADWNSQAKIGYGCGNNSSVENNGLTDAMTYHTGTNAANRTTYGHVRYRYIEGLWDNVTDWCDGIYFSSTTVYAIKNPANFSDTSGGTNVGTRPTANGVATAWNNPSADGFEYALYPSATTADSNYATYNCDYCGCSSSGVVLRVGGSYSQSQGCGAFYLHGNSTASSSNAVTGGRLQKLP